MVEEMSWKQEKKLKNRILVTDNGMGVVIGITGAQPSERELR